MTSLFLMSRPALLLYRHTCRKCRVLSRIIVALSFAAIDRAPITSTQAELVQRACPDSKGKLVLVRGSRIVIGWWVAPEALWCLLTRWISRERVRRSE